MKTIIKKAIKHSLVIDESALKKLLDFIYEKFNNVEINIECADGTLLETKSMDEVIKYDNPNYQQIKSIRVIGQKSGEEDISLSIGQNINSSNPIFDFPLTSPEPIANFKIRSTDAENASGISEKLEKLLLELKPFFLCDFLAKVSLYWIILFLAALNSILYHIKVFFGIILPHTESTSSTLTEISIFFLVILIFSVIMYPIDLFRRWLFPKVFFSLGKQKETMKRIQQWRLWIVGVMTAFGVGWIIKILFY